MMSVWWDSESPSHWMNIIRNFSTKTRERARVRGWRVAKLCACVCVLAPTPPGDRHRHPSAAPPQLVTSSDQFLWTDPDSGEKCAATASPSSSCERKEAPLLCKWPFILPFAVFVATTALSAWDESCFTAVNPTRCRWIGSKGCSRQQHFRRFWMLAECVQKRIVLCFQSALFCRRTSPAGVCYGMGERSRFVLLLI